MKKIMLLAVLFLTTSSVWADNLLINPGFESGDFTGWTVTGGATGFGVDLAGSGIAGSSFGGNTVNVKLGSYAAWGLVRGFCCAAPEALVLSQTLSVTPGTDYTVGFFLSNQSFSGVGYGTGSGTNEIEIFVNGVGLLPSALHGACPLDCLDPSLKWLGFESTFNSGAASSVTVEFQTVASGSGRIGLSMDDFYVLGPSAVPEPSTLALSLLGLGLVVAGSRKSSSN